MKSDAKQTIIDSILQVMFFNSSKEIIDSIFSPETLWAVKQYLQEVEKDK